MDVKRFVVCCLLATVFLFENSTMASEAIATNEVAGAGVAAVTGGELTVAEEGAETGGELTAADGGTETGGELTSTEEGTETEEDEDLLTTEVMDEKFTMVKERVLFPSDLDKQIFVPFWSDCKPICMNDNDCDMFSVMSYVSGGYLCGIAKTKSFTFGRYAEVGLQEGFFAYKHNWEGSGTVLETAKEEGKGFIHRLIGNDEGYTFEEAKEICESGGARLGKIKSARSLNLVKQLTDSIQGFGAWVDLEVMVDYPYYKWSDGTLVNDTTIGSGENYDDNFEEPREHVVIDTAKGYVKTTGKFDAEDSGEKIMVICQQNPLGAA